MTTQTQILLEIGLRAHASGDLETAKSCYEKVLSLDSNSVPANGWLGTIEAQRKNFAKSRVLLERALAVSSDPGFLLNYANVLQETCEYEQALIVYMKVPRRERDQVLLSNLAACHNELGQPEAGLRCADQSLAVAPNNAEAWSNRGNALNDLKRHAEALASYERSIELKPDFAEAWSNRGNALNDLKRYAEALASYDRAIELKPDYAEAWGNRGNALNDLKRNEEALASCDRAIELKPDCAEAWSNRGNALNDLKRHAEALASYERSIELKPDYAEAIHNKSLLQLSQKNFGDGFENYLRRWETRNFTSRLLETELPLCNQTASCKNILLWAEQGIGDEIFYAGLLEQALERFSSISLVADKRLHPTLLRSLPTITLLERGHPLETDFSSKMECQAPIGDLGRILGLGFDKIVSTRRPFLRVNRVKSSEFRSLAPFSRGKTVCGLAWRSNNKSFGEEKSIGLEQLEPILKNNQFEFINLQYGEIDTEIQKVRIQCSVNIHQIEDVDIYNDVDGLLALIDACDIVITTSNITAHLAGSIGKRGCVFVPNSKGRIWYWHHDDVYSLWYPSLRVFYQGDRHDWTDTISQAKIWIEQDVPWKR